MLIHILTLPTTNFWSIVTSDLIDIWKLQNKLTLAKSAILNIVQYCSADSQHPGKHTTTK